MKAIFQLATVLLIFLFSTGIILGQKNIDSLRTAINNSNKLEEKLEIYSYLIREYCNQDPEKALETADIALNMAAELPDSVIVPLLFNSIGIANYYQGNFLLAIEYYLKGLNGFEILGDTDRVANVLNNIGVTYGDINNFEKSKEFYFRGLRIYEKKDNPRANAAILNNIGSSYESLELIDSAEYYYNASLTIAMENNLEENIPDALSNLGNIYLKRKEYDKALDFQNQALQYDLKANNLIGMVETYASFGSIYLELGNYKEAYRYLMLSLKLTVELDMKSRRSEIYEIISRYYEKIGNVNKAFEYFKKYTTLKDSIFTVELRRQIEDLQMSYENNKKEQEIILLNERNRLKDTQLQLQTTKTRLLLVFTILAIFILGLLLLNIRVKSKTNKLLQKQNDKIQNQNVELESRSIKLEELSVEKDNFINVVAHDLKSPLNNISGLANLIQINGKLSEEQTHYLNLLDQVSNESKNLVSNLLDINKLEAGIFEQEVEDFEVQGVVDKIIHNYKKSASEKNITIQKNCNAKLKIENNREFIERILDNIISNAIKFSPDNKNVTISCDFDAKYLILSVLDEGPGIKEDERKDLFKKFTKLSARPTGGESSTGLGMAIVKLLIDKLNGEIEVISEEDRGTEIIVRIPASYSVEI